MERAYLSLIYLKLNILKPKFNFPNSIIVPILHHLISRVNNQETIMKDLKVWLDLILIKVEILEVFHLINQLLLKIRIQLCLLIIMDMAIKDLLHQGKQQLKRLITSKCNSNHFSNLNKFLRNQNYQVDNIIYQYIKSKLSLLKIQ